MDVYNIIRQVYIEDCEIDTRSLVYSNYIIIWIQYVRSTLRFSVFYVQTHGASSLNLSGPLSSCTSFHVMKYDLRVTSANFLRLVSLRVSELYSTIYVILVPSWSFSTSVKLRITNIRVNRGLALL
jgi:hypothetical protein